MAGSMRSTAMLALLRFYQVVAPTQDRPFAQRLLIFAGLFSLCIVAIYMWRSRNYKRMLAYSSVEHLGIVALGMGVGGVALLGALLHLLFNSFGKAALFFMAGNIHRSLRLARNRIDHRPDAPPAVDRLCVGASRFSISSARRLSEFFSARCSF